MIILANFPNTTDIMPLVNELWKNKISNSVIASETNSDYLSIIIFRQEDLAKAQRLLDEFNYNLANGIKKQSSYSLLSVISDFLKKYLTHTPITLGLIFLILLSFLLIKLNLNLALNFLSLESINTINLNFFNWQISLPVTWQIWRYITPIFIHENIYAVIFASFWIFVVGIKTEEVINGKIIILFLFSALIINLLNFSFFNSYYGAGAFPIFHALLTFTFVQNLLFKQSIYNLPNALFLIVMVFMLLGLTDVPILFGTKEFNLLNFIGTVAGGFLASFNFAGIKK